jgi:hypothetical protein
MTPGIQETNSTFTSEGAFYTSTTLNSEGFVLEIREFSRYDELYVGEY